MDCPEDPVDRRSRRPTGIVVAVLTMLVVACGAGPELTATIASTTLPTTTTSSVPPPTTTTTLAPTTTVARTTTIPPTATTTRPGPSHACDDQPSTEIPGDATNLWSITGDVDGDGYDDTVTGYVIDEVEGHLHLELSTGWGTSVRVDDPALADRHLLALSKPNRIVVMSGEHLVVSTIRLGLPGSIHALFAFRNCVLAPITLANGELPDLWYGGGPGQDEWFSCNSTGVVMLQLVTENYDADPRVYLSGNSQRYQYDPPIFVSLGDLEPDLDFPVIADIARDAYPVCPN